MNILIIGAGMYVTGRDNTGTGTILSSISETSKVIDISKVLIVARSARNRDVVASSIEKINNLIGSRLSVAYKSLGDDYPGNLKKICSEEKFDCAIISVPDHLHFEYARLLLESGIHCLVVKPLTPTVEEAMELINIQEKHNLYGLVEFHKRYDETNLYIKRALAEGRLGKILYFTVDYSQKINIPLNTFKLWSDKTNIFQYLGVHYVDLIYFLTGYIPGKACAVGTSGILIENNINTYDSIHATIIWESPVNKSSNFVSQFSVNWIDPNCTSALSDQKYKVIGTKGRIECNQKNRGIELISDETGIQSVNPYFSEYLYDKNGNLEFSGYGFKSISTFLSDVEDLKNRKTTIELLEKSRPTFKKSLLSVAVVEAINKSLSKNFEWMEINDIFRQ